MVIHVPAVIGRVWTELSYTMKCLLSLRNVLVTLVTGKEEHLQLLQLLCESLRGSGSKHPYKYLNLLQTIPKLLAPEYDWMILYWIGNSVFAIVKEEIPKYSPGKENIARMRPGSLQETQVSDSLSQPCFLYCNI